MEVHQEKKSACGKFRDDWEFETMFGKMGRNDLEAVSCQFRTWIFICILHKVLLCLYFPEICIIFGLPSCGLKVLTVFIFHLAASQKHSFKSSSSEQQIWLWFTTCPEIFRSPCVRKANPREVPLERETFLLFLVMCSSIFQSLDIMLL